MRNSISPVSMISTHTLTWSVTSKLIIINIYKINFNSHAHVERDCEDFDFTLNKLNFNTHAHVERDRLRVTI